MPCGTVSGFGIGTTNVPNEEWKSIPRFPFVIFFFVFLAFYLFTKELIKLPLYKLME